MSTTAPSLCTICLETADDEVTTVVAHCAQCVAVFHEACIAAWLKRDPYKLRCPVCRISWCHCTITQRCARHAAIMMMTTPLLCWAAMTTARLAFWAARALVFWLPLWLLWRKWWYARTELLECMEWRSILDPQLGRVYYIAAIPDCWPRADTF
jgi:hypothetical protein